MTSPRRSGHIRSADTPLCDALSQQSGINDFLVCTRPIHSAATDHVCVGDDGSALGSWSTDRQRHATRPVAAVHARAS